MIHRCFYLIIHFQGRNLVSPFSDKPEKNDPLLFGGPEGLVDEPSSIHRVFQVSGNTMFQNMVGFVRLVLSHIILWHIAIKLKLTPIPGFKKRDFWDQLMKSRHFL